MQLPNLYINSLLISLLVGFPAVFAQRFELSAPGGAAAATVEIDVSDLLGRPMPTWVEFYDSEGSLANRTHLPQGVGAVELKAGKYDSQIHVLHMGTQFLVSAKELQLRRGETEYLLVSLAEGSANLGLDKFDRDHDLVLDRVEIELGTDPDDPSSIPGHERLNWPSPVLKSSPGWYIGDLHTFSKYSIGSENIREIISRAERSGLDFLAITDRNTLDHIRDEAYRSDQLVLIPGMEWGTDQAGYALILNPGTVPRQAEDDFAAQAVLDRVVQQGGVFAPAHPCFPTSPWLRTIGFFNGVEIWCREWRMVPPLSTEQLPEALLVRSDDNYIFPLARATRTTMQSANGQAEYFWRMNLSAGRKSAALAGSHSASPKVPLGSPLTSVYAENKSLKAIIDGIRRGRTIVRRDQDSPTIDFRADALNDGKIETKIGDIIPTRRETRFYITIDGGLGKKLEVLVNGKPIRTLDLLLDHFEYGFLDTPASFSHYIVRVTEKTTEEGFGFSEVLAVTSPIYAQEIVFVDEMSGRSSWVEIEAAPPVPDNLPLPPVNQ